jgi:ABC-type Fe3+/spermidine/putrescine transport system ATPase subunit
VDEDAPGGPVLELRGLHKRFGETAAVDGLDLSLRPGELLTLLGPSGCGKTTVLRLVAGFETPDAGSVRFREEDVTGWSPRRRGFGMVFQNYALFPHLDVAGNVAFGLESRDAPAEEIPDRVERALELVDLPGFGDRPVQELSGGQQQRVAVARALAIEPPLLLLDEPLSNLDAALRERTRTELRLLVKELGITTLFVTHDQEEAFDLSDRVAVMDSGSIRQTGTPEALYDRPADPFVAGFVGRANRFEARLERTDDPPSLLLSGGTRWPLPAAARVAPSLDGAEEAAVEAWLRPEDLRLRPLENGSRLRGTVRDRRFRGAVTLYRLEAGPAGLVEVAADREAVAEDEEVDVTPSPGARAHVFPLGAAPPPPGSRAREETG